MRMLSSGLSIALLLSVLSPASSQEMRIGATLSTTGPAASIGIPIKNAFQILPKEIAGVPISWTILDDATDTTVARRNVEKLVADNVDIIIGGNTTPTALAAIDVAGSSHTPTLAIAPSPSIIEPVEGAREWVFKIPLGERELSERTFRDMAKRGIKSFGFIGFNDAFGDGWLKEFERISPQYGIKVVAIEKFARTDTSVTAQVLKVLATHPDAIFVGATSTPATLPTVALRERGFKGPIYQTSGVLNNDFLRVGEKSVEGVLIAGGPLLAANSLPDSNPSKSISQTFTSIFDGAYGAGSTSLFAGNAYDAWLLIQRSASAALKKAKPGTPAFRSALRDALESATGLAVTNGVMNMSKTNHGLYAADTPVMLTVRSGGWALAD